MLTTVPHFPYIKKKNGNDPSHTYHIIGCQRNRPFRKNYQYKQMKRVFFFCLFDSHFYFYSVWYMCKRLHSIIGWLSKMLRSFFFNFKCCHTQFRDLYLVSLYIIFNSSINFWLLIYCVATWNSFQFQF